MIYTDGIHLVGDNLRELHAFAQSVGLKPQWFQYHPNHPHYDITTSRMLRKILSTNIVTIISTKQLLKLSKASKKVNKTIISNTWPEGISNGLTLSCSVCHKQVFFDYLVDDKFWQEVVPKEYRLNVVCLPCLDKLATENGLDVADHLGSIQFTGIGKTIVYLPSQVYYYKK